jgi:hypothetical protein
LAEIASISPFDKLRADIEARAIFLKTSQFIVLLNSPALQGGLRVNIIPALASYN